MSSHFSFVIQPLFQDPDLEAKRKAELEKIKSQKKKFKQKIEENIQKQKHRQLKKKMRRKMKKEKAATVWKLLSLMYIPQLLLLCNNIFMSTSANKCDTMRRTTWVDSLYLYSLTRESLLWLNFTANKIQCFKQVLTVHSFNLFMSRIKDLDANAKSTTESLQWLLHMLQFIVAQKMGKHQSNNITAAGF